MFHIALLFLFMLFLWCMGRQSAGRTFRSSSFMRLFEVVKHSGVSPSLLSDWFSRWCSYGLAGIWAFSQPLSLRSIWTTQCCSLAVHTLPRIWRTASFSAFFCRACLHVMGHTAAACCTAFYLLCDSIAEASGMMELMCICQMVLP